LDLYFDNQCCQHCAHGLQRDENDDNDQPESLAAANAIAAKLSFGATGRDYLVAFD
jgi:hypothetical protein